MLKQFRTEMTTSPQVIIQTVFLFWAKIRINK